MIEQEFVGAKHGPVEVLDRLPTRHGRGFRFVLVAG
jgi:hypothetical protein